ncbi:guanine nucleotide exchange factor [Gymnopilus junonius]|uniref:Guanine nucleotide exchange factor n=1 Tax=Gymnopilus junonius TaxID=109634 RepID=A0A9P5TVX9_GYMJU|nr:guanine nucleotide exchange factor [Gymnopilus junonius]
MTDIFNAYAAITPSSPRNEVSTVFNIIINALPFSFDKTSRIELIKAILTDLKGYGPKSKLNSKDVTLALSSVKTLGKDPAGSEYLSLPANLSILLGFTTTFKDDPEASSEALRCIANALLLIEQARSTFISKEINGGDTCILLLEKSTSPDHVFILSRILFLATASGSAYIQTMVESKHHGRTLVEILGNKLDLMGTALRNGTRTAKEAATDLLKFIFNVLVHYPKLSEAQPQHSQARGDDKIIGDFWDSRLDGILAPLLRTFHNLPLSSPTPIAAPLTHVIHALITIPITPSLKPIWFGQSSGSARNSAGTSPKSRTPQPSDSSPGSRSDSPVPSNPSPTSPKPSTLDRALSVLAAGRRSLSRTPSPSAGVSLDVLQRAYDLLDTTFAHYFPGDVDPDDLELRQKVKAETSDSLDDMLSPLIVLISRFCIGDEGCKIRVRQWIVPDDLDRTSPLEQRSDILGRCLRLLSSVYHPRLKDAVGEMLYAAADSDASTLSSLVGYGNVAGFLFHKGVLSAPQPSSSSGSGPSLTTPAGQDINPITGTTFQPKPATPEMTDEEKEREMEKLFVLFDRLEKTGALPPDQNPMRKAIQQGKLGN